jgi:hypothetical protein
MERSRIWPWQMVLLMWSRYCLERSSSPAPTMLAKVLNAVQTPLRTMASTLFRRLVSSGPAAGSGRGSDWHLAIGHAARSASGTAPTSWRPSRSASCTQEARSRHINDPRQQASRSRQSTKERACTYESWVSRKPWSQRKVGSRRWRYRRTQGYSAPPSPQRVGSTISPDISVPPR